MSQLPDEIYVPEDSKYGTLDYVIAFLDLEAAKEAGYEREEVQEYVPTYRRDEFYYFVKKMRDAQVKYETLRVKSQYVNEASREDFDAIAEAAYEAFVLENEVDKMITDELERD